jgi:hypothetical protein
LVCLQEDKQNPGVGGARKGGKYSTREEQSFEEEVGGRAIGLWSKRVCPCFILGRVASA